MWLRPAPSRCTPFAHLADYDVRVPLSRQQIYRRRRLTVFTGLAVVLGAVFYLPMTLLAPISGVSALPVAYTAPVSTAASVNTPDYGASGIGMVGEPGLLGSAGSQEAIPIASISKIISTLVVLDAHPIAAGESGDIITFTDEDVEIYYDYIAVNGSVKSVEAGMELSQREVVELMLVGSANNYANSLVSWAFGSEDDYVPAANAWLAEHGLTSTSVSDATGMSPENVSTPTDLVALGKLAIADPLISEIIAMKSVDVPDVGELDNTNKLLGVDGIDGIKTGTLDEAGACLLFSADVAVGSQTVTLVGVILGGPDHGTVNKNVRTLLASAAEGLHEVTLATAGQSFASYDTPWGEAANAVATENSSVVVFSDTPVAAEVSPASVSVAQAGNDAGEVVFTVGDKVIAVPLELDSTIDDPGAWWRLTHPGELF